MKESFLTRANAHLGVQAEKDTLRWWLAFCLFLLTPWMLVWSRVGSEAVFGGVGLLFLWRSISAGDWRWANNITIRFGFALWLWMLLVSSPFAAASQLESFAVAVPWIRFLLFYAAARFWILRDIPARQVFAWSLLPFFLFIIVDTFVQYLTGTSLTGHVVDESNRLTGPMDNVKVGIFMAKLLVPWVGIALVLRPRTRTILYDAAVLLIFVLGWFTILLSGERTAFLTSTLGIVAGFIFLALAEKKLRGVCLSLLVLLLGGAFIAFKTQSWIQFRADMLVEQLSDFKHSTYGQLFRVGYELGKQYWLTGTGFKGFRALCPQFLGTDGIDFCSLHPHNPYIEFFAETGVVGLLLFAGVTVSLFREAAKKMFNTSGLERILPAAALAAWVVNFFPFMPTQSIYSNWPAMVLWLSVSIGFSGLNGPRDSGEVSPPAA